MRKRWTGLILMMIMLCFLVREAECNITMKTLVVNPSKTKIQTATLKAYLPKEVKPEDIIDLGDLKIDYDVEKALYYVHEKFELEPGKSVNCQIEMKDVWVISKAQIDALSSQAKELMEKLKKTAYFDMAVTLQKDIETKSSKILNKQENAMDALPQTHIAVYRNNMETLDSVNTTLVKLEKMVTKTKTSGDGSRIERISVKSTWRLIVAMIIALGLLSFAFFIIWHRQAAIEETKKKVESEE